MKKREIKPVSVDKYIIKDEDYNESDDYKEEDLSEERKKKRARKPRKGKAAKLDKDNKEWEQAFDD